MNDVNDLLAEMFRTEYVNAAFILDQNGYVLGQRIRRLTFDREESALQTLAVAGVVERFGAQFHLGDSQQIMLEFDNGVVMMAPFAVEYMLIVIAAPSVTLGLFRTFFGGFLQRLTKRMLVAQH